jgi:aromatic-amino-acid transaminase
MFENITMAPADPILGLNEKFLSDSRSDKINLGVGVYKDDSGNTPILNSVKKAETRLLADENSKTYLGIPGSADYALAVQQLLFGADSSIIAEGRAQTAQTPGGTGGLRLAAELISRQIGAPRVWVSDPTWANHVGIFQAAGLEISRYAYYDADTHDMDFEAMLADLGQASAGDVVLLHGCCHNPTGIDPDREQWARLAELCSTRGLLIASSGRGWPSCVRLAACCRYSILLIRDLRAASMKTPRACAFLPSNVTKSWLPVRSRKTSAFTVSVPARSRW